MHPATEPVFDIVIAPAALSLRKRVMDVVVASCGLILLAPIALIVMASIWIVEGRPTFFRQQRPGLQGKAFTIIKFRTMRLPRRDGLGDSDASRLTPLGVWLRRKSLDELPTLVNVLRGDMSLVGPRPLLTEYLPRYSTQQLRRHSVRPGLTGLAQISGRNQVDWERRFRLDVWYVDHWRFLLDLKILWRTIAVVLRQEGISESGQATMTPFSGRRQVDSDPLVDK
ncbi:MAG: sugar transferase [Gemmatimonadota bacterium]